MTPRVVIAGLSGDAGKTLVAVGLAASLRKRGLTVAPYKKGPDYIDAAWLAVAAGRPGRNLDTFLMPPAALGDSLARAGAVDVILVEGNRGLHDGSDAQGTHSTAALAKQLEAPVVLVVDATKATRTLAACVRGCAVIDPDLLLAGVILNRVASTRHERVIREAFAALGGPPVLGALPKLGDDPLPSRHLGLVTAVEHGASGRAIERAAATVTAHVDVEAVLAVARRARPATFPARAPREAPNGRGVRVGILRDEAFSFYYPENLEALAEAGAEVIDVSPLRSPSLPDVDALYIGGGFPEVHAAALSANGGFLRSVRAAVDGGLPVYAECGGLMYLARELRVAGHAHSMAGVLDLAVEQTSRPQGHGYVEAVVDAPNAFFPVGARLRGHEFHYSRPVGGTTPGALRLERGTGLGGGRDGGVRGRVWASYLHLHALGTPSWAPGLVAAARGERPHAEGA
ncbi:MAG TPA: cobyrinate a,c-diamide synthase [Vicinamibacterales bacterium]|nr:cobyrinate a,c-diamide synthase [Vicinamibacterales bacterium]